jgi:hypothetical protein
MPPIIGKKHLSDDQDSDGMGPSSNKPPAQQKQIKKRKRNNTIKRLDQEQDIGKWETRLKMETVARKTI